MPFFAVIGAGYYCGRKGLLGEDSGAALNLFVYWVALPALLFRAMAGIDVSTLFNPQFLAGYIGPITVVWAVLLFAGPRLFGLTLGETALHGMNSVYGNTGYMGIPLAIAAFGQTAALPAIVATIVNTALIVGTAIILIEIDKKGEGSIPRLAAKVAGGLVRNPMLSAPALGLAWALTGLKLPVAIDSFASILGAAAGPCALFSIGLFLIGKQQGGGKAEIALMTALKLGVLPALTALMVLAIYPADPMWAKVAILMAALPTGAGSFVLAQAYGVYVLRTTSAILITTVFSLATISILFLLFPPAA